MQQLYDRIGQTYQPYRRPDLRIATALATALDNSASVLNVGAGTGSYEPIDREVVAAELSMTMIRQRDDTAAPVVQANSISLPFADNSFDAALAILTVHHWQDQFQGLTELSRVARDRVVVLTWDPAAAGFWLTDYFPEILAIDRVIFPGLNVFAKALGDIEVIELPIPCNCSDGFLGAYWQRPDAYLDAGIRSAISTFTRLKDIEASLQALANDLDSGVWEQRYGFLCQQKELDLGYRLVIAEL